jgi:hypothetical protein
MAPPRAAVALKIARTAECETERIVINTAAGCCPGLAVIRRPSQRGVRSAMADKLVR